jgi:hypothetical protein
MHRPSGMMFLRHLRMQQLLPQHLSFAYRDREEDLDLFEKLDFVEEDLHAWLPAIVYRKLPLRNLDV